MEQGQDVGNVLIPVSLTMIRLVAYEKREMRMIYYSGIREFDRWSCVDVHFINAA